MLERALIVLCATAEPEGDARVVTDPWSAMERVGLPRDAVAELLRTGAIIGLGRLRFRIDREHLPQPEAAPIPGAEQSMPLRPCVLLVVDVENAVHAHAETGVLFDPSRIRDAANRVGPVGFAFGLANLHAVAPGHLAALALAGFHCIHCERLPDATGGKDTVDELLRDLVRRFCDHTMLSAIVLVSDDRDFASILNLARDRGIRAVVLTFRKRLALGRIAEHRLIPLPHPPKPPTDAATTNARRWNPEDVYDELRNLLTLTRPEDHEIALARIQTRSPLVQRFLRAFFRKYYGGWGKRPMSYHGLVALAEYIVRPEDQVYITRDALSATFSALVTIGVFQKTTVQESEGPRTRYEPHWSHPLIAYCVHDIPPENVGRERVHIRTLLRKSRAANVAVHGATAPDDAP